MHRAIIAAFFLWACGTAQAHELTPTYPRFQYSHLEGVKRVTLRIFNKRSDVQFYEIGVFNKEFEPVQFATSYRVLNVPYLTTTIFDIYVRDADTADVMYICTESKLKKTSSVRTVITSRICSKIQKG